MILPEITYSLSNLSKAVQEYAALSGKTENEALLKQAGKLAYFIRQGLRAVSPKKGAVRAENLSALKSGRGVKVRDAVWADIAGRYGATTSIASGKTFLNVRRGKKVVAMGTEIEKNGKRMNLQALAVERELNIRESARGFLSYSVSKYASLLGRKYVDDAEIMSRYGFLLSELNISVSAERKYVQFRWLGAKSSDYQTAVAGLSKDRQKKIINDAATATTADIKVYIERKLAEAARSTGFN